MVDRIGADHDDVPVDDRSPGRGVVRGGLVASAAWVLLFDVLCVGSCTNTPEAGLVSWLVIGCAVVGAALLLVARRRRLGRALLAGAIVLAAAATLAG